MAYNAETLPESPIAGISGIFVSDVGLRNVPQGCESTPYSEGRSSQEKQEVSQGQKEETQKIFVFIRKLDDC